MNTYFNVELNKRVRQLCGLDSRFFPNKLESLISSGIGKNQHTVQNSAKVSHISIHFY